jgi:hypothetical protein
MRSMTKRSFLSVNVAPAESVEEMQVLNPFFRPRKGGESQKESEKPS